MSRWPKVEPELRRRLLRELRRRQASEDARRPAADRVRDAEQLRAFSQSFGHSSGADEPAELWLSMLRRFRAAPGPRSG